MPDSKITALTSISTSTDPANDPLVIVDLSDTSMAATGTTKKVTLNQLLATSPTATLASATISGALDAARLNVTGATIPANGVYLGSANKLSFSAASTLGMTLDATGLGVGVAPSAGGGCLQLKSGITFPATQVASSDANTLDDYEEGTFVPTVRGSTTSGTGTYTTQFGRYTKVGRLVTVSVTLVWTAHTGTGNLQFAGLPFASANTASAYDGIAIAYQSSISSAANTVLYGLVEFGSTVVTMTATPVGGGGYGLVALDTAGEIAFTATYTV